jgi:phospholipid/cholesterol/gamma-HCH transport system ATP-binding protein
MSAFIKSLKFEKVTLGFEDAEILQACDFDFPMNQNCRIVFNNDREKFFFFHGLSQISGFQKGKYLMNGEDVTQFSFEEFLPYRLKIGFGFSTRGLIHNRTLRQNLELPLYYHNFVPKSEVKDWMRTCIEYFNFEDDLDKRPADVSPNSQKATLVLRAFIHKPELVFLDTPEMMLSKKLQANFLQLVDDHRKYHNLKHLFIATNDEDLSDCLVEKNIILSKKRLNQVVVNKLKRFAS